MLEKALQCWHYTGFPLDCLFSLFYMLVQRCSFKIVCGIVKVKRVHCETGRQLNKPRKKVSQPSRRSCSYIFTATDTIRSEARIVLYGFGVCLHLGAYLTMHQHNHMNQTVAHFHGIRSILIRIVCKYPPCRVHSALCEHGFHKSETNVRL